MTICNECGFLLPNEREEFLAAKQFHLREKAGVHHCIKYNVDVIHRKPDTGYGAPIYPCAECDGNPYENVG